MGVLLLGPDTPSLGLAPWGPGLTLPYRDVENWLGVPLSPRPCYRLSHPGEPGVPARTAFLPINPHGVSVRTQCPGLIHRWGNWGFETGWHGFG